jgi:hypothetical protein
LQSSVTFSTRKGDYCWLFHSHKGPHDWVFFPSFEWALLLWPTIEVISCWEALQHFNGKPLWPLSKYGVFGVYILKMSKYIGVGMGSKPTPDIHTSTPKLIYSIMSCYKYTILLNFRSYVLVTSKCIHI